MCSFDVSSLFTNILLNGAIEIGIINIMKHNKNLKLSTEDLKELFNYCTKYSNFTFNNEHYNQISGVAMGSILAPILAHVFMSNLEENIDKYKGKKPEVNCRYSDDIFMIINRIQKDTQNFKKFMNTLETIMRLTVEVQKNGKLCFLDIMIGRTDQNLITHVCHRPTDTRLISKMA